MSVNLAKATSFTVRPDAFALTGDGAPRYQGCYVVDEDGGAYRGWNVASYAAAVELAGIYAIRAGVASDILYREV